MHWTRSAGLAAALLLMTGYGASAQAQSCPGGKIRGLVTSSGRALCNLGVVANDNGNEAGFAARGSGGASGGDRPGDNSGTPGDSNPAGKLRFWRKRWRVGPGWLDRQRPGRRRPRRWRLQ